MYPINHIKLGNSFDNFEIGQKSGKVVNQIIDQLFDGEDSPLEEDNRFSDNLNMQQIFFNHKPQFPQTNLRETNSYNPFSSPFGLMHKGMNNSNTTMSDNNSHGYVGQHLNLKKDVKHTSKPGCECEMCQMKELEKIFSFAPMHNLRSYSSGNIAGGISNLMNIQDYMN